MATNKKASRTKVQLPSPLELAKLAALLDPAGANERQHAALAKAARLFLCACEFHKAYDGADLENFAGTVSGDFDKWLELLRDRTELRLNCSKPSDEVRFYLKRNGLELSKGRSVLDNLKEWLLCIRAREWLQATRQTVALREGMSQKQTEDAIVEQAQKSGMPTNEWEESWRRWIEKYRSKDAADHGVYFIPESILDDLIAWKSARKRSGGYSSQTKVIEVFPEKPIDPSK